MLMLFVSSVGDFFSPLPLTSGSIVDIGKSILVVAFSVATLRLDSIFLGSAGNNGVINLCIGPLTKPLL